ncbi:putative glycoside hydrolase [soil metagenome]
MRQDELSHGGRPRRWTKVSWWYSLILLVAVLLFVVTVLIDRLGSDPAVSGVVTDAYTGEPVEGVQVSAGATAVETDGSGEFSFESPLSGSLAVSREDYESTQIAVSPTDDQLAIQIRPTTLTGVVTNLRTNAPLAGATVSVASPNRATVKTVTGEDGMYLLFDVPADAIVTVEHPGLSPVSETVGNNLVLDFDVLPDILTGRIVDEAGQPVESALIELGDESTLSASDGSYRLAGVPDEGQVFIKRAGYRAFVGEYPADMIMDATLESLQVKAIYVSALAAGNDQRWREMLELIDSTELNTVVLDVKDELGIVRYDTAVPLANEIGAAAPAYDLASRLEDLEEREIYVVARLVVFADPLLAAQRPDLAVKDLNSGGVWTTWDGQSWVNALSPDVWQYNIDLATEVAAAGFDEIQLDYLRFPTDGPIEIADYGAPADPDARVAAMSEFLRRMRAALTPGDVYLAADVSGLAVWDESDNGIGQDVDEIVPHVDIVNPFLYPAHFPPGTFGYDFPNDHPYQVIKVNLERILDRFGASAFKFRPWLQDFSTGLGIDYGAEEVRAQIDAAEEFGETGWMLWNDANIYSTPALTPR